MPPTLESLRLALAQGVTSSRELVQRCLARIQDPVGEGARTFLHVDVQAALAAADAVDRERRAGRCTRPYAGIPVSIKDLFDIQGQTTTAGSRVLAGQPPATRDADAVARLKAAGFIPIGRTNMTEFAYSGLGLNPHYGTPLNPYDRATGRIPGGSSSGAAISVTDGMAVVALGTDTGGSCRIPAALTGLVGYKPTASRVSLRGAYPLSSALDSIGPIGASVDCCAIVDAILAGEPVQLDQCADLKGLRIGIPQTLVLDGLDTDVSHAFASALQHLSQAGAQIIDMPFHEFAELAVINAKGGYTAAEAYRAHRYLMAEKGQHYDPRVRVRIEKGAQQTHADIIELDRLRADWIRRVEAHLLHVDLIACPTVPTIAPTLAELTNDEAYGRINLAMLRNPTFINFLNGCAISMPCHQPNEAPVGLMFAAQAGRDASLFAAARAVEALLATR
ncbi:amidase [Mesopusillimonas faecipullorum]|nr:amidase [Mesopusillimonas faecipullorum]